MFRSWLAVIVFTLFSPTQPGNAITTTVGGVFGRGCCVVVSLVVAKLLLLLPPPVTVVALVTWVDDSKPLE